MFALLSVGFFSKHVVVLNHTWKVSFVLKAVCRVSSGFDANDADHFFTVRVAH